MLRSSSSSSRRPPPRHNRCFTAQVLITLHLFIWHLSLWLCPCVSLFISIAVWIEEKEAKITETLSFVSGINGCFAVLCHWHMQHEKSPMLSGYIALRFYGVFVSVFVVRCKSTTFYLVRLIPNPAVLCTYLPYMRLWKFYAAGFKSDASFCLTEKQRYKQTTHSLPLFYFCCMISGSEMRVYSIWIWRFCFWAVVKPT